ncbi:MAG: tRNA 2-thiouridine(34) synthase MnmA [Patescibacteria group bacterium]|jgi:tRNA-specific 2-thiouridylase|nr:tRNA 2-thiouridine(34) synthase MnmA [Patescibacteria group bacterium]
MSKNVFVGMSGGVDSSVTALLLSRQGYKVSGVYMKNWTRNIAGFNCPWEEDYRDAKRVAVSLDIPLLVFDFEKQYREKVVNYMIDGYKQGITPNPDIICNQEIKFKLFFDLSMQSGADLIATGHYGRIVKGHLKTAVDQNKDQTYFLYRMSQQSLSKTLMPIGDYKKSEIRNIAKKNNLATATKKDSQGICFIGEVGIKEFLINELGPQPSGPIIDDQQKEVGVHDGAIFYTIGQRHGLNIGGGLPYYVIDKDISKNIVYVSRNLDNPNLWSKEIRLTNFYFTYNNFDYINKKLKVRIRYRGDLIDCDLRVKGDKAFIGLKQAAKAVARGQSAVLYYGQYCIGGGIIV